jgi:hypothetical protein
LFITHLCASHENTESGIKKKEGPLSPLVFLFSLSSGEPEFSILSTHANLVEIHEIHECKQTARLVRVRQKRKKRNIFYRSPLKNDWPRPTECSQKVDLFPPKQQQQQQQQKECCLNGRGHWQSGGGPGLTLTSHQIETTTTHTDGCVPFP